MGMLVLELTILYSQTRCELWLKTILSQIKLFLTSTEALRRWLTSLNGKYNFEVVILCAKACGDTFSRT